MDDALRAFDAGRADGLAGRRDPGQAEHPDTGGDYRAGLTEGQLAVFESDLVAAIRRALGDAGTR
jgi:hypothetical protein